jgi:hypothetical protein
VYQRAENLLLIMEVNISSFSPFYLIPFLVPQISVSFRVSQAEIETQGDDLSNSGTKLVNTPSAMMRHRLTGPENLKLISVESGLSACHHHWHHFNRMEQGLSLLPQPGWTIGGFKWAYSAKAPKLF